jgi:hypothetical protein
MVVALRKSVAYWAIYDQKVTFCNSIYCGQNLPVPVREKIDDDFSETTKLLISFDEIMLRLYFKAHLIVNCMLYNNDQCKIQNCDERNRVILQKQLIYPYQKSLDPLNQYT